MNFAAFSTSVVEKAAKFGARRATCSRHSPRVLFRQDNDPATGATPMSKLSFSSPRCTAALAAVALIAGSGMVGLASGPTAAATAGPLTVGPARQLTDTPPDAGHGSGQNGAGAYGWASSNWSGYAVQTTAASPFRTASGTWTVPAVHRPNKGNEGFSATWVGLDGFFNSQATLIQTGTEEDYYSGSGHYAAWWTSSSEGYAEQVITGGCSRGGANCGVVSPGDTMTATVTTDGSIRLVDDAAGHAWTFTTTIDGYAGDGLSAEWIMEAPSSRSKTLPLPNYGQTTFDHGTVNGRPSNLAAGDGGYMVQRGGIVSIPSSPDSDTDGFAIAYGSTAPSAPGS
jgi:hypothetical protein